MGVMRLPSGAMCRYEDCRCPITECEANKGDKGCFCNYMVTGHSCDHPRYRDTWAMIMEQRGGLQQLDFLAFVDENSLKE